MSARRKARRPASRPASGRPSAVSVAVLCLALGLQSGLYHQQQIAAYTPHRELTNMALADWWRDAWEQLPRLRTDTRGRGEHPLNLQYAGDPETLRRALEAAGWRPAQTLGWNSLLHLLTPSLTLQQLPVLPQVHDGRHESLALEKPLADGGRLVLRLWPADIRLQPGRVPLWVGNVSAQTQRRILRLFNFPETLGEFGAARAQLTDDSRALRQRLPTTADRSGPVLIDGTN